MSNFVKVKKFMQTFGQEVKNGPSFPSEKIVKLRCDLINEELTELKLAIKNNDITEVADALTDILYVTYGAGHAFGIDLDECFDEDMLGLPQPPFFSEPSDLVTPFADGTDWEDAALQLQGDITIALLLSRESTDQMFPRGSVSARCGQFVSLQDSPGTDSITYAGMKR